MTVVGIAMAVALVVLLDVLGRAFVDISILPFKNLSSDLIVQRSATKSSIPEEMGLMLPYSAQVITAAELSRLKSEQGVLEVGGYVLLWNFGRGRFFSISGLSFDTDSAKLGPAKVRDWLIKGRLPEAGQKEVLVERHYGAFYRLKPGKTIKLAGETYTVSGVVDLTGGSQMASSNFYLDINQARQLAKLPNDAVNQVFLKLAHIDKTESIKKHIATWLPQASITSPGTMLKLFGGISQVIGSFRSAALAGGALAASALILMLLSGTMAERRRETSVLRTLGWTRHQVRRQLSAEMMLQGVVGGLLALLLVAVGLSVMETITIQLPANLPGENPADFAVGGFKAAPQKVALPLTTTLWDWFTPTAAAGIFCGLCGWFLSARTTAGSLWTAIKAA